MSKTPKSAAASAKRALRHQVLARRAAMSPLERILGSQEIFTRLLDLPVFQQARGVHLFMSLPEEVDTAAILRASIKAGKAVFLPYQVPAEQRLGCAHWGPDQWLEAGPLGILEPAPECRASVDLAAIDLVLVPGVAFDRRGGRLGYGKGYYDRFLAEVAERRGSLPALVALAFSVQIVEAVPLDGWDVRIPQVLTERELIVTRGVTDRADSGDPAAG